MDHIWHSFCRGLSRYVVAVRPSVCLSARPSATFVDSVKANKHIFNIFSPSGSWAILVFFHTKRHGDIPTPDGGVECKWGRLKSRNQRISGLAINNCCTVVCISHFAAGFLFTAGIGRPSATGCVHSPSSVTAQCETDQARSRAMHSHGRPWIVCMTARLGITLKTTEQNRTVRTGKSEAEVTNNNKKLSCRRETARRFLSLNILFSHSRLFKTTLQSRACVSSY